MPWNFKMKKILFLIASIASHSAIADGHQQFTQQSQAAIKEFSGTLKGSLVAAMKSGGPIEAITVCNQVAPIIAEELSKKYGMEIARTSLKVRNQSNKADAWEKEVLTQFEQLKENGDPVPSLVFSETVNADNGQEMRLMKAIPTGKVCLKCHGSNIDESVQKSIHELYPDDQATGFKLGDIRGAFTIRKAVEQ